MADQDVRRRDAGAMQQLVQLGGHRRAGTRERARIAPAFARAVEPAGFGELGNFRLDLRPRVPRVTCAGLEDHRRTPLTRAEDVQAPPADIYRSADLRESFAIPAFTNLFVRDARERNDQHERAEPPGGMSTARRLLVVALVERPPRT